MTNSLLEKRDRDAANKLRSVTDQSQFIESTLTTNERVIARVTDGIYRQPGSAIRELLANAYDADATWVSVKTDAPIFSRITIEDDGTGMSPEAVIHLLHNIGGSAKRTEQGQELGISSSTDPSKTPNGRRLIGKLGIGIFSVSQLTHSFQIITKTKSDEYRTVVVVNLQQFADEPKDGTQAEFKAGTYQIWRERTTDVEAHGTTIVLTAIRPQTRDSLRSEQLWSAVDNPVSEEAGEKTQSMIPEYHIGRLDSQNLFVENGDKRLRNLPWKDDDTPDVAFSKMVNCVWSSAKGKSSVKLSEIFDTYLQMLWNLALALPLPYVEGSVLDERVDDEWAYFYSLSNKVKGSAQRLFPDESLSTVRSLAGLEPAEKVVGDFKVIVDGVQLSRPLKFRGLPTTQHVLKKPMVFVGSMKEEFKSLSRDISAGPLQFDAYLVWNPKIAPTEHQGVLVRIHGASGTLFDSKFFNYQVAESTRLRQVTCEIFVKKGLEAALNIDRESFNTAHPHTVLLTRWVHSALRQLATAQKKMAQELREEQRTKTKLGTKDRITRIVASANELRTDGEGVVPSIKFGWSNEKAQPHIDDDTQFFDISDIARGIPDQSAKPRLESISRLEAITALLSLYGALENLSIRERDNLLGSILGILEADVDV